MTTRGEKPACPPDWEVKLVTAKHIRFKWGTFSITAHDARRMFCYTHGRREKFPESRSQIEGK